MIQMKIPWAEKGGQEDRSGIMVRGEIEGVSKCMKVLMGCGEREQGFWGRRMMD
jgi:hypothetical protein